MGIGTLIHGTLAVVNLMSGNIPGALAEGGEALKGYLVGKALEPVMEPVKEVIGNCVAETCDPDIVDNIPYL